MTAVRQYAPYAQPVSKETEQETLARLATLSAFEYERLREAEARKLNVRPATLDKEVAKARRRASEAAEDPEVDDFLVDPEPWPEPVDLADLLERITETFKSYMVLPPGAPEALALWVMHAHAHDCSMISPVLGISSPTPECGKTTLLSLLGALVPRALPASNITAAALFRAVEKWQPTLLIDEADTFLRSSDEMRGVLNSGHQRVNAYVIRTTGDNHEPKRFCTWAPKAIALIGKLPATLTSRAIPVQLRRKAAGEDVKALRLDRMEHLEPLCRQAARWVADNGMKLRAIDPDMPAEISNRVADNWRPLLAIAVAAGGDWPDRARRIAVGDRRPEQVTGIMLLEDINAVFAAERVDRIPSQDLVAKLANMEDRPWVEWHNGKPITPRQLAKLLEPFEVKPDTIRMGSGTAKGYLLDQFTDAFARYTPSRSVTPEQINKINGLRTNHSVTQDSVVTDKKSEKTNDFNGRYGVTDESTPLGQRRLCAECSEGDKPDNELLEAYTGTDKTWLHRSCAARMNMVCRSGNGARPVANSSSRASGS